MLFMEIITVVRVMWNTQIHFVGRLQGILVLKYVVHLVTAVP
jgi:hypothetical protein